MFDETSFPLVPKAAGGPFRGLLIGNLAAAAPLLERAYPGRPEIVGLHISGLRHLQRQQARENALRMIQSGGLDLVIADTIFQLGLSEMSQMRFFEAACASGTRVLVIEGEIDTGSSTWTRDWESDSLVRRPPTVLESEGEDE